MNQPATPGANPPSAPRARSSIMPPRVRPRKFGESLVIHCPEDCSTQLSQLLAQFILDGVRHVYLAGPQGGDIKARIDTLLARGGFGAQMHTIWYEGQPLEGVVSFVSRYCRQPPGGMQVVQL